MSFVFSDDCCDRISSKLRLDAVSWVEGEESWQIEARVAMPECRRKSSANSISGLEQMQSSVRSWPSECWQWLWLVPILQDDPTQRWRLSQMLPRPSESR